jgi:glutaredoxin
MDDLLDVTFYTRPGCHLCEVAHAELQNLMRQFPIALRVVDITSDSEAHARWWAEIPVIEIEGAILRAPIEPTHLRKTLLQRLRARI